jgi:hypothetical protein
MKIRLVKFVIGWLMRNHKWLLYEAVVGDGKHIHSNPRKRGAYPVRGE